jgi:hypothetical protein
MIARSRAICRIQLWKLMGAVVRALMGSWVCGLSVPVLFVNKETSPSCLENPGLCDSSLQPPHRLFAQLTELHPVARSIDRAVDLSIHQYHYDN